MNENPKYHITPSKPTDPTYSPNFKFHFPQPTSPFLPSFLPSFRSINKQSKQNKQASKAKLLTSPDPFLSTQAVPPCGPEHKILYILSVLVHTRQSLCWRRSTLHVFIVRSTKYKYIHGELGMGLFYNNIYQIRLKLLELS